MGEANKRSHLLWIRLRWTSFTLRIVATVEITYNGNPQVGFAVESAMHGKGLGLVSMRERVRLVNGTIAIESKPMGETTIHVRVPFDPARASERAAG